MAQETSLRFRPKPVEHRSFWNPLCKTPQGVLRMWVDVLTPEQAKRFAPVCSLYCVVVCCVWVCVVWLGMPESVHI